MRSDLRILWVDDTKDFYDASKELLETYLEDDEITVDFDYFNDVDEVVTRINRDAIGFKMYDIMFIDFTLSNKVNGNELIVKLRDIKVDADILFYSSNRKDEIKDIVTNDIERFEGIYISSREDFENKARYLIDKNVRKQVNIMNIRGFLMDQTSENDFTVNSYILKYFDSLTTEQKEHIKDLIIRNISGKKEMYNQKISETIESLQRRGITNIKTVMRLPSGIIPVAFKYEIFEAMVGFRDENVFEEVSIEDYFLEIVRARNTLAHKKLDICKQQKYLLYYDDFAQFNNRKCPEKCEEHNDEYKYSLQQWNNIRKKTKRFGKSIDLLQEKLFVSD